MSFGVGVCWPVSPPGSAAGTDADPTFHRMSNTPKFTLRALLRIRVDARLELVAGTVFLADAATAGDLVARDLAVLCDPDDAQRLIDCVDALDRRAA